jgi:hypothetical protein
LASNLASITSQNDVGWKWILSWECSTDECCDSNAWIIIVGSDFLSLSTMWWQSSSERSCWDHLLIISMELMFGSCEFWLDWLVCRNKYTE